MSRLTAWIEKTYKPKVNESKTTQSLYYYLFGGGFSIRVSDHLFSTEDKACDINIIYSENDKKNYIIMLKDARGMLTYSLARVKIFIEDATAVWKMRKSAMIAKEAKKEKKVEKKKELESHLELDKLSRVNDENWQALVDNHIINDIPGWKTLVRSQRRECKVLFADYHEIPYKTCVNVINNILKKNKIIDVNVIRDGVSHYLVKTYKNEYTLAIIYYDQQEIIKKCEGL
jgi:hypothetical protein